MTAGDGRARAPDTRLPLTYLGTAATAFVIAAVAVPWLAPELSGHYYHPRVLALTHTITLGWITLAIMGASYQLIPIVLKCPLWSEHLARWQLAALVVGIAGIVAHFFVAEWSGLVWAAALVAVATAAHVVNIALTLRALATWTFVARFVVIALIGISLTILVGLALAVDHLHQHLRGDFYARLHAHVHLALLGWVLPMIVGVAERTFPMFLLGAAHDDRLERIELWGIVAGVPALVVGLLGWKILAVAGAAGVAAAVAAHLASIVRIARARKRPTLDWPVCFLLSGAVLLVPAALLGMALLLDVIRGPRWALAYAVLGIGGWISLTIVGMMLKIVPFLAWYAAFGSVAGRAPVPSLAQLGWPAAEAVAFVGLAGGVVVLTAGVAVGWPPGIRLGGVLLAAGALAFAATLARVLRHLVPGRRMVHAVDSVR